MLKKRRWQMVLLLFIAGIINYLGPLGPVGRRAVGQQ